MADVMKFEVVTPERVLFREQIEAMIMPGADGRLGILPKHAPMVVLLRPGVVKYRQGGQDRVVLLADTAEKAADIDILRAQQAKERALRRLRSRDETIDQARARAALERALARLNAAAVD